MRNDGELVLDTCVRTYGHTKTLKSGSVGIPGVRLNFIEVEPQIAAFRRMVRDLEFDLCEVAPTTYIIARAYGVPFTALPIFFERKFHHGGLVVRPDSGIQTPKDLEGNKVGVRAYSVTTGVWTRGIYQNEYGVDPAKVTWVVDDEEHVRELPLPPNVVHVPEGKSLASMMREGEIQAGFLANAGIGREGPPQAGWAAKAPPAPTDYRELIPDADRLGAEFCRRTGIYPFHSTLVIKDEVLARDPSLGQKIYDAFASAKQVYVDALLAGETSGKSDQRLREQAEIVGGDPLPYGLEVNRPSIQALITYAEQQRLIPRRLAPEDLFLDVRESRKAAAA